MKASDQVGQYTGSLQKEQGRESDRLDVSSRKDKM